MVNTIWGKIIGYRNIGDRGKPRLEAGRPLRCEGTASVPAWTWWKPAPGEFVSQWRTTPVVHDLDSDGLKDLVMLDHEGYLAWFPRARVGDDLRLRGGRRIFLTGDGRAYDSGHREQKGQAKPGDPLRLNTGRAGRSGRRKIALVDWNGDGRLDLLVNSMNAHFLENIAEKEGEYRFVDRGPVAKRAVGSHTTSPAIVDWNRDGKPDLVLGAEDGYFYYLRNPKS